MIFTDSKVDLSEDVETAFEDVGYWTLDVTEQSYTFSETASSILSGSAAVTISSAEDFLSYCHPDDIELIKTTSRKTLATGLPYELEHRVIHQNGNVHWVRCQSFYAASTGCYTGVIEKLDNHAGNGRLIHGDRRFLECLLSKAPALVMTFNADGSINYINQKCESVLGYSLAEVKGENLIELFLPAAERDKTYAQLDRVMQGEVYEEQVSGAVTKDGRLIKVEWAAKLLLDVDQLPICGLVIGQDVTEKYALLTQLQASNDRFHELVEMTPDWIWEIDREGRYSYVSPQVERILGWRPEDLLGHSAFEFMPKEEAERLSEWFIEIEAEHHPIVQKENINLHKSGSERVMETCARPFFDENGNYQGYRGVDRDVTERSTYQQKQDLSSLVLEHTPEGVMITDADRNIIKINPAFCRMTGYTEQEILGQNPRILSSQRHDKDFYKTMWFSISTKGYWQGEIWNRRKDGEIYPEWLNISSIKDGAGRVTYYAAIFSDISTQTQIRNQLHNLAYYDALTGLPNRELFYDRLSKALIQAERGQEMVSVMFLDIDHFKRVNDSFGHNVGDLLLKKVSEVLSGCLRASDTVARIGGDEFTILLTGVTSLESVVRIAEKILTTLEKPFDLGNDIHSYVGGSIGISHYPMDGADADTLLKHADNAMYRAKDKGRNMYQFFTAEMNERAMERLQIEHDLREAIQKQELALAYQPQVDIASGRVMGLEALLRWHHPIRGWISPATFVPIAEESGLIGRLGDWVLETALIQLAEWHRDYDKNLRIAVNLSAHQLYMNKIPQKIDEMLKQHQLPPHSLELELTESSLIQNVEYVTRVLNELQSLGIELAIDDFGTGYSSLSYLKQFNVDRLKIDRSFVTDISTDPSDAEIVATIIAMANTLNLKVIAEGVETAAQASFLDYHGCNEAQGFYYSAPIDAEHVSAILMRGGHINNH